MTDRAPQRSDFQRVADNIWELPQTWREDMRAPARIFASEAMLQDMFSDRMLWQLVNTATIPGVFQWALAMPDAHEGYGFPVGGVVATALPDGLISPGGIGYDINCGVRLLATEARYEDVADDMADLATQIQRDVPSGVGRGGALELGDQDLATLLDTGPRWLVERDYGTEEDLLHTESHGYLDGADNTTVSNKAKKRGNDQIGTLGAGNHFLEIQRVDRTVDPNIAKAFGLHEGQVVIMIHTGSRGLGHQIATDYIKEAVHTMHDYNIDLPDRELAGVPFSSEAGQRYWAAMQCGAHFAWSNRQLITHRIRRAWQRIVGGGTVRVVYDVAHNIAKKERYNEQAVIVHRKGATRAFAPGHPELADAYREVGQPVLIPGSMGTSSWVLAGTAEGATTSFSSSCHGAGRRMSRTQAKQEVWGGDLKKELEERGITVRAGSMPGLAEEAPLAYKDVNNVVDVVDAVGIAQKVAQLKPVAVIKG